MGGNFIAPLEDNGPGRRLRGAASLGAAVSAGAPAETLVAALARRGLSANGSGGSGVEAALSRLGVRQPEDLQWIGEADLLSVGMNLVQARKLLSE